MEIIVARNLKSSTIADIAYDMGLQSPHVVKTEEWGGAGVFLLTHGPRAFRQTVQISVKATEAEVRAKLQEATAPPCQKVQPPPAVASEAVAAKPEKKVKRAPARP